MVLWCCCKSTSVIWESDSPTCVLKGPGEHGDGQGERLADFFCAKQNICFDMDPVFEPPMSGGDPLF